MSVKVALANCCQTTGEGPHWDISSQTLFFVDILNGGVHQWKPSTGEHQSIHLDDTVGFVIPRDSGGQVIGLGRRIATLDWDSKTTTTLGEVDVGTKNRFNDAKCDPSGRLWAGTMGYEAVPANPERQVGSLFCLDKNLSLSSVLQKIDISNGLAWTRDHKKMYFIDSFPRKIYSFDFDVNTGSISNQKVCIDFGGDETRDALGLPDGMCIDAEDNIWVACYGVGKVIRFDPRTGKEMRVLNFPAKRTTSCCFGGADLSTLYVTCGKSGLTEEEFKNEQPLAGSLFEVTGLGVSGVPSVSFSG